MCKAQNRRHRDLIRYRKAFLETGVGLDTWIAQQDMFEAQRIDEVEMLLRAMHGSKYVSSLREILDAYVNIVDTIDTATGSLFGDVPETTKREALEQALGQERPDKPTPVVPPTPPRGGTKPPAHKGPDSGKSDTPPEPSKPKPAKPTKVAEPEPQPEPEPPAPKPEPQPEPDLPAAAEGTPDLPATPPPAVRLARKISLLLRRGEQITNQTFFRIADTVFGGTRSQGRYGASEAYDALELAVNMVLADDTNPAHDLAADAVATVARIGEIIKLLPTQTARSGEKTLLQQFSTPPHYGYVVAWLANIGPNDVVLEPSAGTGNLVRQAANAAPHTVIANELSATRGALLKYAGANVVYNEDAEHIAKILPSRLDRRPTVVIMNPPFSHAGTRMGEKKIIGMDLKHVEEALALLEDGGRLVAIVSAPLQYERTGQDSKTFQNWMKRIAQKYAFRANVFVGRDVYTKYGTSFPTRLIIIDKVKPAGQPAVLGKKAEQISDLIPLLEEIRNENRPRVDRGGKPPQPQLAKPGVPKTHAKTQDPDTPVLPVQPPTDVVGPGEPPRGDAASKSSPGDRRRPDGGADVAEPPAGDGGVHAGGRASDERPIPDGEQPSGNILVQRDGTRAGTGSDGTRPAEPGHDDNDGLVTSAKNPPKKISDSVFEAYRPSKLRIKNAKPHPASLVEPAAMSSVELPEPTYTPNLPEKLISSGVLTDVALEQITYAGQSHAQMLPPDKDGTMFRRGYMIGDGTGVGKGRMIAGIILDNLRQGRRKAVWISQNKTLFEDATRDWRDLGQNPAQLLSIEKIKAGQEIKHDGILFTTYYTLGMTAKPGEQSRLEQLVEWLGPDFDGVIAFDEAHNMANAVAQQSGRHKRKPAAMALAGVELQRLLPNARIVYVSATAATEVRNLAYMHRLGLWGPGTPFSNVNAFVGSITAGGVGAMELVAQNLKAMGLYLSRSISFNDGTPEGTVTYRRLEHALTDEQREVYNRLANAWQIVLRNFHAAAVAVSDNETTPISLRNTMSVFWSAHQRFFNSVITSMQLPSILPAIENDLANGRSVLIQLTSTGQAQQERSLASREEGQDLEDIDLSPKQALIDLVQSYFPVTQYQTVLDENGNEIQVPLVDSLGNPVLNPEAVRMRDELLMEIGSLPVPNVSPIDHIIQHFGVKMVAEATARTQRLVRNDQGNVVIERRGKNAVDRDIKRFNSGDARIIIFSQAGSTGASYHASRTVPNQQKRIHYVIQPGWRADVALQGLGRSHRSNQRQAPEYVLVHTDLKAQKRFISSIARRLNQLGALTRGQRQAASGVFSAADNLESQEAQLAYHGLLRDLVRDHVPGVSIDEFEEQTGLRLRDKDGNPKLTFPPITQFLNRMLSMTIDKQNILFDEFATRLDEIVERAIQEGTLDTGVETIHAESIVKDHEEIVRRDEATGAVTRYVRLLIKTKARFNTWDMIQHGMRYGRGRARFARTPSGKLVAIFKAVSDRTDKNTGAVIKQLRLVDQRRSWFVDEKNVTDDRYPPVADTDAERLWQEAIDAAPQLDESEAHLVTGLLLPIWNLLPNTHFKVLRLQTDDGEIMIGRSIPDNALDETLAKLGATTETRDYTEKIPELLEQLLDGKITINLGNNWKIKRSIVMGQHRIEIVGPSFLDRSIVQAAGGFVELIGSQTRYFIPTGENTESVFRRILGIAPIMSVAEAHRPAFALTRELIDNRAAMYSGENVSTPAVTEAALRHVFPRAEIRRVGNDFEVTTPNGRKILVRTVANIPTPQYRLDAIRKAYPHLTEAQLRQMGVAGMFVSAESADKEGEFVGAADMMFLVSGLSRGTRTVRHESLHWAKALGLFTDAEWAGLTRRYAANLPSTNPAAIEEAIAKALEPDHTIWKRIRFFFERIVAMLLRHRDPLTAAGYEAEAKFRRGDLWSRTKGELRLGPDQRSALERAIEALRTAYGLARTDDIVRTLGRDNALAVAPRIRAEARRILAEARRQQSGFLDAVRAAAASTGLEFHEESVPKAIKGIRRMIDKLMDGGRVSDALRSTVLLRQGAPPSPELIQQFVAAMEANGYTLRKADNLFEDPRLGAYRRVQLNFTKPGRDLSTEVLLIQPAMFRAKEQIGHLLYEILRVRKEVLKHHYSDLVEELTDLFTRTARAMNNLYHAAYRLDNRASVSASLPSSANVSISSWESALSALVQNFIKSSNVQPFMNRSTPTAASRMVSPDISAFEATIHHLSRYLADKASIPHQAIRPTDTVRPRITTANIQQYRGNVNVDALKAIGNILPKLYDMPAFRRAARTRNDITPRIVQLDKLISRKDNLKDPKFLAGLKGDPRQKAADSMVAAARNEIPKRAPIDVYENGDGTYTILDGNATAQAAPDPPAPMALGVPMAKHAQLVGRSTPRRDGQRRWRCGTGALPGAGEILAPLRFDPCAQATPNWVY